MEKTDNNKMPFNLQVENLSVQFGDCHSSTYYNGGGCDCGCHGDFECPEPLPSWNEYSDFFAADDDGFQIDMDKMAEKIHKDTGIDLDVVKTVLYAESEIMDDLGIMDMVLDSDGCSDDAEDEEEASGKEKHILFEGMTHEEACDATERLLKAIFPELKDKKFTFAVGTVGKGSNVADKKEDAHGKKN